MWNPNSSLFGVVRLSLIRGEMTSSIVNCNCCYESDGVRSLFIGLILSLTPRIWRLQMVSPVSAANCELLREILRNT
jgi:hypothetical protein